MAFVISDPIFTKACFDKAVEINADKIAYGVSDMIQYAGHITNVYFLQGLTEIAHITGLQLEKCQTTKEAMEKVAFYNRRWSVITLDQYDVVRVK